MNTMTIKHNGTTAEVEGSLEKAVLSMELQRESKQFSDVSMKSAKEKSDTIVSDLFENMIQEISKVLTE